MGRRAQLHLRQLPQPGEVRSVADGATFQQDCAGKLEDLSKFMQRIERIRRKSNGRQCLSTKPEQCCAYIK